MEPGSDFKFHISERPDEVTIQISGSIDEVSELTVPDARGRRVVIDAHRVHRINSLGVRAWVEMMEALSQQTADVVLVRMPALLLTQASMISTFLGNARVHSFTSPWVCLQCDHVQEETHEANDPVPETLPCPNCGSQMELDWDRESFLAFRHR